MEAARRVLAAADGGGAALWAALEAASAALLPPTGARQLSLYCHVLVEALAAQERRCGAAERRRRVVAAESAVLRLAEASQGPEASRLPSGDARLLRSAFVRLMERMLVAAEGERARQAAMLAAARLATLLASLWMLEDRGRSADKAAGLLTACVEVLRKSRGVEQIASGPLFLLGMMELAEREEKKSAVQTLREAAALQARLGEEGQTGGIPRGVVHYWLAVALFLNGRLDEAVATLKLCVRANYEPVACLMLSALLHLKTLDYREASDELQRGLEIDFSQSVSMFNYAVLLGRLGSFDSQAQMLQFYCESISGPENTLGGAKKRQRESFYWTTERDSGASSIIDMRKLQDALPFTAPHVPMRLVNLHLALAAMETGNWLESKTQFEAYLEEDTASIFEESPAQQINIAEATRDYIFVLLQSHHFSLALNRAEGFLAMNTNDTTWSIDLARTIILIHLYKADALLCLERVDACQQYLKKVVSPLISKHQTAIPEQEDIDNEASSSGELARCHIQLLNNLAVATVCSEGVDQGITILRQAIAYYPLSLVLKFNLTLLLWRTNQKETACTLWIEARGWNLHAKSEDLPAQEKLQRALALASNSDQATGLTNAALISEHVSDTQGPDGVTEYQLVCLDVMVLDHWRKVRDSAAVENSLLYVKYLESLTDTSAK